MDWNYVVYRAKELLDKVDEVQLRIGIYLTCLIGSILFIYWAV